MKHVAVAAAGVLLMLPLSAQAQSVDATRRHEARRIEQGVRSGTLDRREYRRLERRRWRLRREERRMRARHNGHLTRGERLRLKAQEADLSRRIWRLKHNARVR